jgi:predicted metal-dependent phosphoesterase TrpH
MEMKINRNTVLLIIVMQLLLVTCAAGQARREINFPDILGYKTLKCDFHIHTVFSDGTVWPTVRVEEAWREGLDAISITDHIEYQPHKQDIPINFDRSYEIALPGARQKNILLIKGAEITRATPPGHFNCLYVEDIDTLNTKDLIDATQAANAQGAFIFWNHPGWKPEHKGWFDIHTQLYENKLMRGIEVTNGDSYYPEAHQWAIEKKLTMFGNSDIHQPALELETTTQNHRTMTLVFARKRTADAVKEALTRGRTAVWFQNQLIGKSRYLEAIFKESIEIGKPHYHTKGVVWVTIRNNSAVDLEMERAGTQGPEKLTLPANVTTLLKCETEESAEELRLSYVARNFLIAPDKGLPVDLTINLR